MKNKNLVKFAAAITLQCSLGAAFAVNNVQLPDIQPGNLDQIGRYSTVGLGIPSQNNNLSVELGTVINGKAYLSMGQHCIGDRWPTDPLPPPPNTSKAGTPVQGGVLVIDVNDPKHPFEAGRLPWSVASPIATDVPGSPITTTRPQYLRAATAGTPIAAKLGSTTILAVVWDGTSCLPRFSGTGLPSGINTIELWDISNPDPKKAKYLSYFQVRDVNAILATDEPNGVSPSNLRFFEQGKKDYIAVAVGGSNLGTLKFFDITNPTQPKLVASWGPEQYAFGINSAAVSGATPATLPSVETLRNYVTTIDPKAFGYSVRGFFPGNTVGYISINKDASRAYVSASNAGLFLLDISNLNKIKIVSLARDLTDAARRQAVGSSYTAVSKDEKTVVERAASPRSFIKFTINSEPDYYVNVAEAGFAASIATTPPFNGTWATTASNLVYLGDACDPAYIPQATGDQFAMVVRGTCSFLVKVGNVQAKGYKGHLVINGLGFGNLAISQGGIPTTPVTIPSVGIPYYAGLKVLNPALIPANYPVPAQFQTTYLPGLPALPSCRPPADGGAIVDPLAVCGKLAVNSTVTNTGYLKGTGMRIWNYKNEKSPVLVSTLDTLCTNNPGFPECNIPGVDFSASEPKIISNTKLYVPWSADGLFKLDLNKPASPKYEANFKDLSTAFSSLNGGTASFPVIVPIKKSGCIFTSTSVGGLYVFDDPTDNKRCGRDDNHGCSGGDDD